MANKQKEKDFDTLEAMRDALTESTNEFIPRKQRAAQPPSDTSGSTAAPAGAPEKEPAPQADTVQKKAHPDSDTTLAGQPRQAGKKEPEKLEQQVQQPLSDEERKRRSQQKLQQFLTETTGNIYSDSKGFRGPTMFATGQFEHKHINPEDVKTFREMKITDTQVRQYQKFRSQRLKKAEGFNLERETLGTARVRPVFAPQPADDKPEQPTPLTDRREDDELEYQTPADADRVWDYLSRFRRTSFWTAVGLGLLTAALVVWALLPVMGVSLPSLLTPEVPVPFLTIHFLLLAGAGAAAWDVLRSGFSALFHRHANADSVGALMVAGCALQNLSFYFSGGALSADSNVFLLTPVAVGCLCFQYIGKQLLAVRAQQNFRFVSAEEYDRFAAGVISNEDLAAAFTRGRIQHKPVVAFNRKAGFLTDFMYYSFLEDLTDRVAVFLAPVGLCLAVVLAGAALVLSGSVWICATMFAAVLCVVSGFSFLLSVNLPLTVAQKRLKPVGATLLGYEAAAEFGGLNAVMTSARKLFPEDTVTLRGMRMCNEHPIDDSILNAASILQVSNSVLRDMFMKILLGHENYLRQVDSVLFEDGLGVSGWVDDRRVIVGSRDMMINHNIALPEPVSLEKFNQPGWELAYVAISGELTAVFAYTLEADESVAAALHLLEASDIVLVAQTVDPVVTAQRLAEVFDIDPEMFKILPARYHKPYRKQVKSVERAGSAAVNNGRFTAYARSVVAAKRLRSSTLFSMTLSLAGSALAVLFLVYCVVSGSLGQFSSLPMLLYQLIVAAVVAAVPFLRRL